MEEEKGIKDNVEEVKENLQAGPSLTAGAEPREEGSMVLRTEDLVKKYGKRTVVSHVSIDVKQGEIVGLLGPNGAGKTTSFYMTVGLITPNEGRIFLNDLDITKYPVYKRAQTGIGYLAQEASVFRQMSVEDNIASVLEMTDKPLEYQKDKLESLIAEFRLQKVRKNKGNQLSGGERRRAEIARCLAIDPKFIMLDEPFAGVDPIAVQDIQSIVAKLKHKNIGILITANLGVMNLLPLPALDGGRLVFLIIEAIRGKRVSSDKEGMVHFAGFALLMVLMVVVMFNDIMKLV